MLSETPFWKYRLIKGRSKYIYYFNRKVLTAMSFRQTISQSTWQKITASLLAATIAVAFVPNVLGNNVVNAATTKNKDNTCLGTSKIAPPSTPSADSEWSGSKVYFGTYDDEPILFRVLAPNTSAYGGSTLFLDSDETLFRAYFENSSTYSN